VDAGRALSSPEEKRQKLRADLAAARQRAQGHVHQAHAQMQQGLRGALRWRWSIPIALSAGAGLVLAGVVTWRSRGSRTRIGSARTGVMATLYSTLWSVAMRSAGRYLETRLLSLPDTLRRKEAGDSLRGDEAP
jgi:hypothetical protein